MAPADTDREAARAVEGILARSGCRIAEALSGEIHQAYSGRFDLRPRPSTIYCPTHRTTRMPCGLCPPGV
jgi:hypothetical protein